MAQRTMYKGRLTPITEVWTDDKVVIDGELVEMLSRESVRKLVSIPQVQTLITYRITEGANKGRILVKTYLDGDELEVYSDAGIFTRFFKWFNRRGVHGKEGHWHNHEIFKGYPVHK